jgi:hypothetical protein
LSGSRVFMPGAVFPRALTAAPSAFPLSQGLRESATHLVDSIAARLMARDPGLPSEARGGGLPWVPADSPSLAAGLPGQALFLAYHGLWAGSRQTLLEANNLLLGCAQRLSEAPLSLALFHGLLGTLWTIEHFQRRGLAIAKGLRDVRWDTDQILVRNLASSEKVVCYDLTTGIVGLGVYALERQRGPRPSRLLSAVIEKLVCSAERRNPGQAWFTPPELLSQDEKALCPVGYYNLGMAHGVTGVVSFLCRVLEETNPGGAAQPILESAVEWLLSRRLNSGLGLKMPCWENPTGRIRMARLGWCYGDAVAGLAVMRAGQCTQRSDWVSEGTSMALDSGAVRDHRALVADPFICHGSAGLAHVYRRLFQRTGHPAFHEASLFWLQKTLGFFGYSTERARTEPARDEQSELESPGLLMGLAGVGLAALGFLSDTKYPWDRFLLTDGPAS